MTVKAELELVSAETLNAALPLFAIVSGSCAEVPVAMVPKLSDTGRAVYRFVIHNDLEGLTKLDLGELTADIQKSRIARKSRAAKASRSIP